MSVDYYSCNCCGEALYEEFIDSCNLCEKTLCVDCLDLDTDKPIHGRYVYPYYIGEAEEDAELMERLIEKYGEEKVQNMIDEGGINPLFCPYCNGSIIDAEDLLEFIVNKYSLNLEELKQEYLSK